MSRPVTYSPKEEPGEWRLRAACRQSYGSHFPTAASNTPLYRVQVAVALSMCDTCPVRSECFDLAFRNGEKDGIWGGVIFPAGARAHRRRLAREAQDQ